MRCENGIYNVQAKEGLMALHDYYYQRPIGKQISEGYINTLPVSNSSLLPETGSTPWPPPHHRPIGIPSFLATMPVSRVARRLDQQNPSTKSSFITTQAHHAKSPARSAITLKNQENPVSSPRMRSPYARPRRAVHKPDRFTPSLDDTAATGKGAGSDQNSLDLKALRGFRSMSISASGGGAGQKSRKVSGPKTKVKRKGPPAKLHVGNSPSAGTKYRSSGQLQMQGYGQGQAQPINGQQHTVNQYRYVSSSHGLLSPSYTLPAYGVQTHQPSFHPAPHQYNPFPHGLPAMPGVLHSASNSTTHGYGQETMLNQMTLPVMLPKPPVKAVEAESVLSSDAGATMVSVKTLCIMLACFTNIPLASQSLPEMIKTLREKGSNLLLANSLYRPIKPTSIPSLPQSASTATTSSARSATLPPIQEHQAQASSSRSVTPTPTSQATAQMQSEASAQLNGQGVTIDATLPLGIPSAIMEKSINPSRAGMKAVEEMRETLKGFEPDHCLAVRSSRMRGGGNGKAVLTEAEMKEEIGRIIPVQ